jgi:alpha-L-rhamnosidase
MTPSTTAHVADLWVEHRRDAPFVATSRPRVSWIVDGVERGWAQAAAEIRLDEGETVRVEGSGHLLRAWPFASALAPGERRRIDVRVQGASGEWTPWSTPRTVQSALVAWRATFLGLTRPERTAQPLLARRRVTLSGPVSSALLHVSALGAVRARIDGAVVDDAVLAPGWTSYQERVLYDTIDVTAHLTGDQAVVVLEGTGAWYTEAYGFDGAMKRVYGDQPALAAQLEIRYADGTTETVVTDAGWEVRGDGEIVESGIYGGETVDLRRRREWDRESSGWSTPQLVDAPTPLARRSEPVRVVDTLAPAEITRTDRGTYLLDFGQNFAGRLRLRASGPAGHRIGIRHAEVLENGELALRPLRFAQAHDQFVLAGDGVEELVPFGTFHGFRFAEIDGWPGALAPEDVHAEVLSSDTRRVGWFSSSHALLDRLHENVVWSTRSNFLSVPTDCPQRDERMGWTGDAAVFAPTALTLFDATAFLSNWLDDLAIEQRRHSGVVPFVVPDVLGFPAAPTAGWGDAAVLVPTALFEHSGDAEILAERHGSMQAWVDAVTRVAGEEGLWEGTLQFGDWLDPTSPPDAPGRARADRDLVATAYRYRVVQAAREAAERIGDSAAAERHRALAERVREAFVAAYVTPSGRMLSDSPTAYVLALRFGLITDPDQRRGAAERLVACVRRDGYHIGTGFLGTPHLLDALTDAGHTTTAEALLLETENPSWLYPVTQGATTVWERWDSLLEDGSINPGEMTSFNHYAFGAVVDWMYRRLAGVTAIEPGYARIRFAPTPLSALDHASATLDTAAGRVEAGWRRDGDKTIARLVVPAHARAVVVLPWAPAEVEVGPGVHEWSAPFTPPVPRAGADPVSLFSPLHAVVDDERAYRAVTRALGEFGEQGRTFRARTDWGASSPLISALFTLPPSAAGVIAAALAAVDD